jgi:putative ABC transport system substrate-binding protein
MTRRRREIIMLLGGAAAWPLAARAQQAALPLIGILASATPLSPDTLPGVRKGLGDAGYGEGRNVEIVVRAAERYDQLPAMAADLVRARVAVIVAIALPAALAAKTATATIPIVFFAGDDPVRAGLVTSFSRPTGNLTGVTNLASSLFLKRLGLLRELVPTAGVFGVLFNVENPNTERRLSDLEQAARSIGQKITVLNATREEDFETAFAGAVQQRVVALLISDDRFFASRTERLAALAASHGLPTISFNTEFAAAGGLISYEAAPGQVYPQIGLYVGRILKGEKPTDLPIVQPIKFELAINLKSAKALGVTIPPTVFAIADEVIE